MFADIHTFFTTNWFGIAILILLQSLDLRLFLPRR